MVTDSNSQSANGRATLKDVARRAGVSTKTVSRVVNGERGVVNELALRVRDAITALNYQPNLGARALRRLDGRSSTIAVLLEDLSNPFSARVLRSIEEVARRRGVSVLAASLEENPERERHLVDAMSRHRVDGVIIAPASDDHAYLENERQAGVPFVFVDRPPRSLDADSVIVEARTGTRDAVMHLMNHGHDRIAFLGDLTRIATAVERLAGYHEALSTPPGRSDPRLIATELRSIEQARRVAREMLDASDPPTAFFAGQNLLTMGVVYALRDRGLSRRVALVGFDDFDLADLLDPAISVVVQDPAEIGERAASLLFDRIEGSASAPRCERLTTRFLPRGSGEILGPRHLMPHG